MQFFLDFLSVWMFVRSSRKNYRADFDAVFDDR